MEEREVSSVLDSKPSRIYGYPLTVKQKIRFHYIIPGICFTIIYVLNFSLDVGIGIDLLIENRKLYGFMTLVLMYIPAFVYYLQQIFQPPYPRNCKIITSWLMKETGLFIFFPYRIIKWEPFESAKVRKMATKEYKKVASVKGKLTGVQLFWIIEIIRVKEYQEESLLGYEECFSQSVENYLFFQIFLQNIPQAILQLHMLTIGISTYDETDVFQAFGALASLLMAATNIMRLHRYESQRIGGRKPIWEVSPPPTPIPTPVPGIRNDVEVQNPLIPKQSTEIRLPLRKPRLKALEEDNPIGKLFLFLFWFAFLLARTLALTTAAHFFPKLVAGIIAAHVFIMFIYYIWYPIAIYRKLFLTITSIFFIFEVGIKIQKIGYLYLLFIVTTLVEDIGSTILWYIWGKWSGWWYNYNIYVIINAHILMLIFFTVYLAFFKPKVKYINRDHNAPSNRSSVITI